jgi:hypothetical protein
MKLDKILVSLSLILTAMSAVGQVQNNSDSLRQVNVHRLSTFLSLTSTQESTLIIMEKQFDQQMDSLRSHPMSPQSRTSAMAMALTEHRQQLKQLFTEQQWKKYKAMLDERRAAYLKAAAEKHITIKELPGQ